MEIKTQTIWIEVEKEGTGESLEQELEGILEKKSDMIVMSVDEFKGMAEKIFDAGLEHYKDCVNYWEYGTKIESPDKETYINQLIK